MGQHKHVRITLNGIPVRSVGGSDAYNRIGNSIDHMKKTLEYTHGEAMASGDILREIPADEYLDKIRLSESCGDIAFIFVRRHNQRTKRTIERLVHLRIAYGKAHITADICPERDDMTMDWNDPLYRLINDPTTWDY